MEYVSLPKEPNFDFTLRSGNLMLTFSLRYFKGATYCSITSSLGDTLIKSKRVCNKQFLLPKWRESEFGNYMFVDDNDDYPVYTNFNGSCVLRVYTQEEAEEYRNG